jgi:AraC-like DNA-binding protein
MWSEEHERRAAEMRQRNEREKLASRIGHEHLQIAEMTAATCATERHYTVKELAAMWKLSPNTVTRIFRDEPGVLIIGREHARRGHRGYVTFANSGIRCSTALPKAGGAVKPFDVIALVRARRVGGRSGGVTSSFGVEKPAKAFAEADASDGSLELQAEFIDYGTDRHGNAECCESQQPPKIRIGDKAGAMTTRRNRWPRVRRQLTVTLSAVWARRSIADLDFTFHERKSGIKTLIVMTWIHISDNDLERYYLGMVKGEEELAPLEEHIMACPFCAERAEAAQDYVDALRVAILGFQTGRSEAVPKERETEYP